MTGRDVDAPPFFAGLRGSGQRVAVFDVPDVLPVPGLPGIQLANWAVHNPAELPLAEPPWLLREVRRQGGGRMLIPERLASSPAEDRRILDRLLERARRKGALCRALLAGGRWDLVVAVFGEAHTASHQFWKYRDGSAEDGRIPGGARAVASGADAIGDRDLELDGLAHAIRRVYAEIDRQMGGILDVLPREANVVVLSSSGMKPQYPTTGLSECFCRRLGYQADPASGSAPRRPLDAARRWIPLAWRLALSRRLPRATRERLLADHFRSATDWSRTRAFAIPSAYTSFLRVNLKGREPLGTVEPGAAYDAVLSSLEADLGALVDPATGASAVLRVARAVDLFGGGPPQELPDLFVEWQPVGHFLERVLHPLAELTQERPEFFRDSDHSKTGFLAAAGPLVQARGSLGDIPLLEVAPALVALMGESAPKPRAAAHTLEALVRG